MNVLLDTNVVSELRKPTAAASVLQWIDGLDEDRIFLSVVTLAEIRAGIARLGEGRQRTNLTRWLDVDLPQRFAGRILAVDVASAIIWGDLIVAARRTGLALTAMDGMIGATARAHGLTLATRNVRDFRDLGIELVNPWSIEPAA